jgi:hypothetical protein
VNALLAEAEGDYLLIAYHDDIIHPDHVTTFVPMLIARPEAVIAYGDIRAHYLTGEIVERAYPEIDAVQDPVERAEAVICRKGYWSTPNYGIFRASAVREAGLFRRHRGGEFSADWPWLLKMSLLGEFVRAPEFLCDKYYKAASLSHNWKWNIWEFAGVCEDCARIVMTSSLSATDKARLGALIGAEFAKDQARKGVARLRRS